MFYQGCAPIRLSVRLLHLRQSSLALLLRLGLAEALDLGFVAGREVGLGGAEVDEEVDEEFFAHRKRPFVK